MSPDLGVALREDFASIDIYWFDQILRGRLDGRTRVLDAGCGDGRNLHYLLRKGLDCCGVDLDPVAVARVRHLAATLAPHLGARVETDFVQSPIEHLPWADGSFDAVICSAVLHFARDTDHFLAMVEELWRVLVPKGLFFARLASNIGLESSVGPGRRRVTLPDGSERYIVDESILIEVTDRLGGRLLDPLKTTVVSGQRSMTTWCVVKG